MAFPCLKFILYCYTIAWWSVAFEGWTNWGCGWPSLRFWLVRLVLEFRLIKSLLRLLLVVYSGCCFCGVLEFCDLNAWFAWEMKLVFMVDKNCCDEMTAVGLWTRLEKMNYEGVALFLVVDVVFWCYCCVYYRWVKSFFLSYDRLCAREEMAATLAPREGKASTRLWSFFNIILLSF